MRGHNMGNPLAVAIGIFSLGFFWDGVWMQYKCVATPQFSDDARLDDHNI
jgi:hypothetical protein